MNLIEITEERMLEIIEHNRTHPHSSDEMRACQIAKGIYLIIRIKKEKGG
jgi:hypothetical protein